MIIRAKGITCHYNLRAAAICAKALGTSKEKIHKNLLGIIKTTYKQ
jgi:hypothetical protein